MKILVIGDVHCRNFWRKAIDNNIGKVEKVIFLGDYLDPYPNEFEENPDSMEGIDFYDDYTHMLYDIINLKRNEPEKYILLTGNHTDSYIWTTFPAASRTNRRDWKRYNEFYLEYLNLFNLVWIQDNVIFSHAGITQNWANIVWEKLEFPEDEFPDIKEVAQTLKDTPLKNFNSSYQFLIGNISFYRGGDSSCGSCEWADIREHIHKINGAGQITPNKYEGIYQVFGHTQLKKPLIFDTWACLDCRKGFIIDTLTYEISEC